MDMQTRRSFKFLCNDWLDVTESDGTIVRNIGEASSDDLNDFDFVFQLFVQQGFYDGHIWLSVFFRPIQSNFTTVQRSCTCFCLLFMTMLANAMFYNAGNIIVLIPRNYIVFNPSPPKCTSSSTTQ